MVTSSEVSWYPHRWGLLRCRVAPSALVPWVDTKAGTLTRTLIFVGPPTRRWKETGPLGEALPGTSEEDMIPAHRSILSWGAWYKPAPQEAEGLERWHWLISTWVVVSERGRVGGLSGWLICPLGPPVQEGLWCHLTHRHRGHKPAGLSRPGRGREPSRPHAHIRYQLVVGDLGASNTYKQALFFSWLIFYLLPSNVK